MAGLAAHWDGIETGGALFGLLSHAGRPIIMFVTGPGPDAIHEVHRFCPDIDFLMKTVAFMRNHYGLQYTGNYHSHHDMPIKGLSGPDKKNLHSIAFKNEYHRLCQIVSTFEGKPPADINLSSNPPDNKMPQKKETKLKPAETTPDRQNKIIKLHPFFYIDAAARTEPLLCPINVIPGTSPIREAICRSPNSLFSKFYEFPLSHIIFDEIEPEIEQECNKTELPVRIQKQILQLPKNVRENARVSYIDDLVILSLPLPAKDEKFFIAYKDNPPHKALTVYYAVNQEAGAIINFFQETLYREPHTLLSMIYEKAVRAAKSANLNERHENLSKPSGNQSPDNMKQQREQMDHNLEDNKSKKQNKIGGYDVEQ